MALIRSLLKYMYKIRPKYLKTSFKKTSVSVWEKKAVPKSTKTGEKICNGPDTQLHPTTIPLK